MANFAYLIHGNGRGFVVDPGFEPERLVATAERARVRIEAIVLTHGHHDHVAATGAVTKATGAAVLAHPESSAWPGSSPLDEGAQTIAGVPVDVIHAPGHSPDMVNLVVAGRWLISGDVLFVQDCGRVDLPGSDPDAMWRTLSRLRSLPDALIVCPGHDYGPVPSRTLGDEKRLNPCLTPRSLEEFVRWMQQP